MSEPQPRNPLEGLSIEGTLLERMHIEILDASPERCRGRMPVAGNTQPYGLLHGGASAVLAETVGSVAAAAHAARGGGIAVGIELGCSHHRAVRDGYVEATATALHLGGSVATYGIEIVDEAGALVCSARLTCAVRPRPPARNG